MRSAFGIAGVLGSRPAQSSPFDTWFARPNGFIRRWQQRKYIKHIVIMVQENRSFDNFFATFPEPTARRTDTRHTGRRSRSEKPGLAAADINHDW